MSNTSFSPEIEELIRSTGVNHRWVRVEDGLAEIEGWEKELAQLKPEISTLDRVNVFTDTDAESREKDLKDRVGARQSDVKQDRAAVAEFLDRLGRMEPAFQAAVELERLFKTALATVTPGRLGVVHRELGKWLVRHTSPPVEVSEPPDPAGALQALVTGELCHTRRVVRIIRAVLPLMERRTEMTLKRPRPTCSLLPILFRLVARCRQAFRKDYPDLPWPVDLYRSFRGHGEPEQTGTARRALLELTG